MATIYEMSKKASSIWRTKILKKEILKIEISE